MEFIKFYTRLYYCDAAIDKNNDNNTSVNYYCFVETEANNKKMFTKRQVNNTDLSRQLYTVLKRPSQQQFESFLASNTMQPVP